MEISMDQVRAQAHCLVQSKRAEQEIIGDPMQRRADLQLLPPGKGPCALDGQARDVFPRVIRAQMSPVTNALKKTHLLQDAHMAAVVCKEGSRGNGQNTQTISYLRLGLHQWACYALPFSHSISHSI